MKNKSVLITGASSGLGAACARLFARNGARLILCARRGGRLRELAAELQDTQATASFCLELDVRRFEEARAALAALPAEFHEIDVLVNSAGLAAGREKLQEAEAADWDQMIDTNIKGLLYLTRLVLPGMIARSRGHIVNIGSIAGHEAYSGGSVYCATKSAVDAISRALRLDLLGTPIRVTSIDPGMVETEFSLVRFKGDRAKADEVYRGMRPLTAEDVADAIYYSVTRPPHVNVSQMLLMPTDQAAATQMHRRAAGRGGGRP